MKIFDGHNDSILRFPSPVDESDDGMTVDRFLDGYGTEKTSGSETPPEPGHLDLARARRAGFGAGMFAIFVRPCPETTPREDRWDDSGDSLRLEPPPPLEPRYARWVTNERLDQLERLVEASDGQMRLVESVDELRTCLREGVVGVVVHFEGAAAIDPDLGNLDAYYERGLRSLGLVWSRSNQFGHGVPFEHPASPDTGPGLTDAGMDLVSRCNDLGIVVDLAHCNENGFWDVVDVSSDPLVVSHAGAHEICPSSRNLTDEQLGAIANSGGIVGVTFAASAIRPDGEHDPRTGVGQLVDHFEYVVDRVGVDHVGFGSDFDGATIPDAVGDVTGLPVVVDELRNRGYDESSLEKIARENWLRVLQESWE